MVSPTLFEFVDEDDDDDGDDWSTSDFRHKNEVSYEMSVNTEC